MNPKKIILCLCLLCLLTSCFDSGFTKVAKSFGQHSEEVLLAPAYRSYNAVYKKLYHKTKDAIMMAAKNTEPFTGKVDPDKEYVYSIESQTSHISDDKTMNQYAVTDDEFYNWLHTKNVTEAHYDLIHLNLKGDTAVLINDYFDEFYKTCTHQLDQDMNYRYFVDNEHDVLSLVMRQGITSYFYYSLHRKVYNIDLRTNKLMTNEEMLERYGLDKEQTQQHVFDQLNDLGFRLCNVDEIDVCEANKKDYPEKKVCSENCYTSDDYTTQYFQKEHSAQIEQGGLFTMGDGKLRMIVEIENAQIQLPGVEHVKFVLVDIN